MHSHRTTLWIVMGAATRILNLMNDNWYKLSISTMKMVQFSLFAFGHSVLKQSQNIVQASPLSWHHLGFELYGGLTSAATSDHL